MWVSGNNIDRLGWQVNRISFYMVKQYRNWELVLSGYFFHHNKRTLSYIRDAGYLRSNTFDKSAIKEFQTWSLQQRERDLIHDSSKHGHKKPIFCCFGTCNCRTVRLRIVRMTSSRKMVEALTAKWNSVIINDAKTKPGSCFVVCPKVFPYAIKRTSSYQTEQDEQESEIIKHKLSGQKRDTVTFDV